MRLAFTMIELIFVIVILGIFASVSLHKLSATRDDALIVREKENYSNCISDLFNAYNVKGDIEDINLTAGGIMLSGPNSCMSMKCLVVDVWNDANTTHGDFMIKKSVNRPSYCTHFLPIQFPDTYDNVVLDEFTLQGTKVIY